MSIELVQIHNFCVSAANAIIVMFCRVSGWILAVCGVNGNQAALNLLAFVLVLVFLSFLFGVYWWPTRSAKSAARFFLWPITATLVIYTLMVFFLALTDVLKDAPASSHAVPHAKNASFIHRL